MMPKQTSGYMAQLSPNQPIKINSRKKALGSQPNTPKKAVAKLKPVLAIKVDEVRKELQFCMDIHKHKQMLRTGNAAVVMYIHNRSEFNNNYFSKIRKERSLPLIDTSLPRGIYVWNDVILNEQRNILIYQMQCVVSEAIKKRELKRQSIKLEQSIALFDADHLLLNTACMLASQIIFIINDQDDTIMHDVDFHYLSRQDEPMRAQVLNIVREDELDYRLWANKFDHTFSVEKFKESSFHFNPGGHQYEQMLECFHSWAVDLQMMMPIKQHNNIHIDFLTLMTAMNLIANQSSISLSLPNQQNGIFEHSVKKQIEHFCRGQEQNYRQQLYQFCSSSEDKGFQEIRAFLHNLRMKTLGQFYVQMRQFIHSPEYQSQLEDLRSKIHKLEQSTIQFSAELFNIELSQRMQFWEKRLTLREFQENFLPHLQELLEMKNFHELKYNWVRRLLQEKYTKLLKKVAEEENARLGEEYRLKSQTPAQQQFIWLQKCEEQQQQKFKALTQYVEALREEDKAFQKLIQLKIKIDEDMQLQKKFEELNEEAQTLRELLSQKTQNKRT